jgi:hypothetical protein
LLNLGEVTCLDFLEIINDVEIGFNKKEMAKLAVSLNLCEINGERSQLFFGSLDLPF